MNGRRISATLRLRSRDLTATATELGPARRTERVRAETADLTRCELPSNSRAHFNNVHRTMKHVLRETGSRRFERPLVGFRQRRALKLVFLISIGLRACRSN